MYALSEICAQITQMGGKGGGSKRFTCTAAVTFQINVRIKNVSGSTDTRHESSAEVHSKSREENLPKILQRSFRVKAHVSQKKEVRCPLNGCQQFITILR